MKWTNKRNKNVVFDAFDTIVDKIAKVRGIEDLQEYLYPTEKSLNDHTRIENLVLVADRILNCVSTSHLNSGFKGSQYPLLKPQVGIHLDIDPDGVTSGSIMYNFLKRNFPECDYHLFHAQRNEGHGIEKNLQELKKAKLDLLIVVDSSTNSVEQCKTLSELFDIVIIDHHPISYDNPYALITNCQLGDYPNKSLSGSAMSYLVCEQITKLCNHCMLEEIDLCAIGLIADMMDMGVPENRYLVNQGLLNITNKGLLKLIELQKLGLDDLTTSKLSFNVITLISSATRCNKLEVALELLTTQDGERIEQLASELIKLNNQRKNEQLKLVKRTEKEVKKQLENNIIIVFDANIESNYKGLLANDIAQKYQKPTIVVSEINGLWKGSGRGCDAVTKFKELLIQSGLIEFTEGHDSAFGITILPQNAPLLIKWFNENVTISNTTYDFDLKIKAKFLNESTIKSIEQFSRISGIGAKKPVFKITDIPIQTPKRNSKNIVRKVIGKEKNVVAFTLGKYKAIKFKTNESFGLDIEQAMLQNNNPFCSPKLEILGEVSLNSWTNYKGVVTVDKQFVIIDYKVVS